MMDSLIQGTCKYLLAKDCAGRKFAVYVQNFDRYNMPGAWTKSVTILVDGDTKIGLRKNGKVGERVRTMYQINIT